MLVKLLGAWVVRNLCAPEGQVSLDQIRRKIVGNSTLVFGFLGNSAFLCVWMEVGLKRSKTYTEVSCVAVKSATGLSAARMAKQLAVDSSWVSITESLMFILNLEDVIPVRT